MNEMQYADTTDLAVRGSQPHDPNFETVRPTCLELPKKTADTLRYHIHFQNTGRGPASMVRVATSIPYMANISKIRLELSNRLRFKVAGSMSVTGYNCSWIINPTADSIIFTFTHTSIAVLNGFTNFTDETTMGDIWFNIPMDANVGSVLLSRSSIVFESTSGSVTHYQPPVITNEARSEYKVRCGECDCKKDPCKKRNRFWQWLLCKKC
jgi:hypothetical protein